MSEQPEANGLLAGYSLNPCHSRVDVDHFSMRVREFIESFRDPR
jgi:hypothetical protein